MIYSVRYYDQECTLEFLHLIHCYGLLRISVDEFKLIKIFLLFRSVGGNQITTLPGGIFENLRNLR